MDSHLSEVRNRETELELSSGALSQLPGQWHQAGDICGVLRRRPTKRRHAQLERGRRIEEAGLGRHPIFPK